MKFNPVLATDFYKTHHYAQYPKGTELIYSNFTCRTDKLATFLPDFDHKAVFFGLQGLVQWLFMDVWKREFFGRPKRQVLREYKNRMDRALGESAVSTDHIGALHDLGYLPLLIKALPEGSRVDMRIPLFTIVNTHPDFYWLTNYVETQLSAEMWKAITSATTAYEYRRLLDQFAALTGADRDFVLWQGHDFSMRGMSGVVDAAQSGGGHLLSFTGTDTIPAIEYLAEYYGGDAGGFIGGSVRATEHSVMCMGGEDDEVETFRRLVCDVYPSGIVSIVSDTWDFWNVITNTAQILRREIMGRAGKVVFRPDSGDPVQIICGDYTAPEGSPERAGAIECLWEIFGGAVNAKGYRVLDPHVGLIYGDSITLDRAHRILTGLAAKKFASSNVVFGIGSYTYQLATRDNYGTAIKATYGVVNGEARELYKKPKTDGGSKVSARGLLRVEYENGHFILHERQTPQQERLGLLTPVFKDGELLRRENLADIRRRLMNGGRP